MNKILIATSVFSLMLGVAHAAEGNGDPFADRTPHSVIANQVVRDTGSESTPTYGPGATVLTQGDVLPTNGSNAIVQSANSLPSGFENGTVAYAEARSVQRWVLAHQAVPANRLALATLPR